MRRTLLWLRGVIVFQVMVAFAAASLVLTTDAWAAKVLKKTKKGIIIQLSGGDDFIKGDKVELVSEGAKIGKATIKKVSGKKASAKITSGKAEVGAEVRLAGSGGGKGDTGGDDGDDEDEGVKGSRGRGPARMIGGALIGYSLDQQNVKATNESGTITEDIPMTGGGLSFKGFLDFSLTEQMGILGRFGLENFSVTGTSQNSICTASPDCTTEISYLTADLLLRFNFAPGNFNPFVSGGLGIFIPMAKTTNVLDETKIATTTVFFLGGGANVKLGESLYIPVQVEYGLFPPSNEVSTSFIAVRGGLGLGF